jgi:hypothetical protein
MNSAALAEKTPKHQGRKLERLASGAVRRAGLHHVRRVSQRRDLEQQALTDLQHSLDSVTPFEHL